MAKQIIVFVALTILFVLCLPYSQDAFHCIIVLQQWIFKHLNTIFTGGELSTFIKNVITILAVSFGVSGVFAGIYWGFKRHQFPYFMVTSWIVWLVLITSMVWQR